ncbi:2-amino-5-formylamino-6-ribosylaminopyrimidin-4(3H)-one 5'-monophosphate deformylase [Methanococcus maripaludis]|uniref:2-amino-5-formylamino-6-ribosylaminopyrimidin-4(3H)-one 5'-monophosphate deformylase n=2 Tax=Methanococcus maripaludis TaxID=39152 RepID=ARFB_METM7|nr:2-amino-5-formylamino-6-ribosylaminopyrimidin-4(3H)-one 5'-monophosphate deformylase [Methanococcus maripaludis]A6VHX1.1 RecName: Full=2-amino-5-formylamino-6-ribosylaminopyrimidin-4(3H)-one 5'-monophosphate deformylase; Short=FAPy deformylase; AltName: Full=Formamide hydrolase [Methanococcus maripaludis C7]MBA2861710.1 2-amino-5-formylamino-6-ribosylaminopyrimidin-4(3H)-one 5'-monophosphate deformylase [Methanococcus maripaludis]
MVDLRYGSGNIFNEKVHGIGIIALGSFLENHGSALPIDTDAKIASYIALNVSIITGAKFLGVVLPSTEYSYVKHGIHDSIKDVINYIKYLVENGRKIGINKFLIINCHGGNTLIKDEISKLNHENCFIRMENVCLTHAATDEVSLGYAVGILSEDKMKTHDPEIYEEIGMVGLKEAREKNEAIDLEARSVEENGVFLDRTHGRFLLNELINNYVEIVRNMI